MISKKTMMAKLLLGDMMYIDVVYSTDEKVYADNKEDIVEEYIEFNNIRK